MLIHITLTSSDVNEYVVLVNLVVSLFRSIIYNKSNNGQYGQAYKSEYDSILNDPTAKKNTPDQSKIHVLSWAVRTILLRCLNQP